MGDYLMVIGDTIQNMGWAAKIGGWVAEKVGTVATVAGSATGQGWLAGAGKGMELLGKGAQLLAPLAMPMILLGLLMAVYIPLIPFITWFGALISYATIFVESIAAAPLWGMAHLDPNGEGMGQRTQHGYLFLLNMLLRPILMLVGFIAASALMIILGSILYVMFMPAMANVQGDSVTGLYSILAFLAIFWIVNLMLVQGGMNLIFVIPDQVLNWLGSIGQSHLGKEAESKIYGMIFSVAAMGRNAVAGMGGATQAGKSAESEKQKHQELLGAIRGGRGRRK
jgi:conjugal transfer/type IV secretion protein DotA/TraY